MASRNTGYELDEDFLSAMAEGRVLIRVDNRERNRHNIPIYVGDDDTSHAIYNMAMHFAYDNHPVEECTCHSSIGWVGPSTCTECRDRVATFLSVFQLEILVERERQYNLFLDEQLENVRMAFADAQSSNSPQDPDPDIVPQDGDEFDIGNVTFDDDESDGVGSDCGADGECFAKTKQSTFMNKVGNAMEGYHEVIMEAINKFKDSVEDTCLMDQKYRPMWRIIEGLIFFLFVDMPNVKSIVDMMTYGYRFISTATGMCTIDMFAWIKDYLARDIETQDGDMSDENIPVLEDTGKFFNGSAMKHFKKFFFALTAIGVGRIMDINVDKTMFESIWSAIKTFFVSTDAIVSIFDFMLWLVKNIKGFFGGKRSLRTIFLDANEAEDFDARVASLETTFELIKLGDDKAPSLCTFGMEIARLEILAEKEMAKAKDNKGFRIAIAKQLEKIKKYSNEIHILNQQSPLREAPFAIVLVGGSGVAKSTLGGILVPNLQRAMGVGVGAQYSFNWQPTEKYASGYTGAINTICLDDLANLDAQHTETTAPELILMIINNFKRMAIMAGLEDKGKITIRPSLVYASSNDDSLQSGLSICPVSILRRFNYHIAVRMRPECSLNGMFKVSLDHIPSDHGHDCWLMDVYHYVPKVEDKRHGNIEFDLQGVGLSEVVKFLCAQAIIYNTKQKELVKYMNEIHLQENCKCGIMASICRECIAEKAEKAKLIQVQEEEVNVLHYKMTMQNNKNMYEQVIRQVKNDIDVQAGFMEALRNNINESVDNIRESEAKRKLTTKFYNKVDTSVGWYKASKIYIAIKDIKDNPFTLRQFYIAMGTCFCVTNLCVLTTTSFLLALTGITLTAITTTAVTTVGRFAHTLKMTVPETLTAASKIAEKIACSAVKEYAPLITLIGVCSAAYLVYRRRKVLEAQGSIAKMPAPPGASNSFDPYRPIIVETVDRNVDMSTSCALDMAKLIRKHLHIAVLTGAPGDKEGFCVLTPVCSGKWIIPYHILTRGFTKMSMVRADAIHLNDRREALIEGAWERIGESDLCIIDLPMLGDRKDLTRMFYSEKDNGGKQYSTKSAGALLIWAKPKIKSHPGDESREFISVEKGIHKVNITTGLVNIKSLDYEYRGGSHVSDFITYEGMCGSPIITDNIGSSIAGIHSAGVAGTNTARYCYVSREEVQTAISALNNRGAHVQMCESGDFAKSLDFTGTKFGHTFESRPHSTSSYVEGQYTHCGWNTAQKRHFKSSVKETLIADSVCEQFGVKIQHEAPRYMNHYGPWNVFVTAAAKPSEVDYKTLNQAVADYNGAIHKYWDEHPEENWGDRLHPLCHEAVLAGADGVRGCYAVNQSTSMGIPWVKEKSMFMSPSGETIDGITRPLKLDDKLMVQIAQAEKDILAGLRMYFPHRCNLKDEAVKKGKDKVRVFMGSNFIYLYLMRKYFLTASMLIQEYPELFESAVGINCTSYEWTKLHDHVFKHGPNTCIAGDYVKYDQKFCVKVSLASFKVLIGMLIRAGYTEEQVRACTVLMTETCIGIYDVNGEWLLFASLNPSGHGLTVVINGIGNSLYMRCGYYQLKPPGERRTFKDVVSLITYGDDNVMSVSEDAPWFNHTALQKVMESYGMGYTMAEKDAVSVPYINERQCSFLKRSWVWSEQYKRYLCPIEEMSIFKTLTVTKSSKVLTEQQQAAELINNANREYFFYGKEKFETCHAKLKSISAEFEVTHHLPGGSLSTYQDLEVWYMNV